MQLKKNNFNPASLGRLERLERMEQVERLKRPERPEPLEQAPEEEIVTEPDKRVF